MSRRPPMMMEITLGEMRTLMGDKEWTGQELCALLGYSPKTNIGDTIANRFIRPVSRFPKRYVVK